MIIQIKPKEFIQIVTYISIICIIILYFGNGDITYLDENIQESLEINHNEFEEDNEENIIDIIKESTPEIEPQGLFRNIDYIVEEIAEIFKR